MNTRDLMKDKKSTRGFNKKKKKEENERNGKKQP